MKKILFAISFGMSVVVFNVAYGSQGSNAYPPAPSSMGQQAGQYTQQYPQNPQISHSMKVQTVSNAQQTPQYSYSCPPMGGGYGAHPSVSSGAELSPQFNRYTPPPLPGKYNTLSAPGGDNSHIEQTMPAQIEFPYDSGEEMNGNLRSIVEDLRCRIPDDPVERDDAGYLGAGVKIASNKKRPLTEDDIGKVVEIVGLCGFLRSLDMSNICMDDSKVKFFVDRLISEITSGKYNIGWKWGNNSLAVDVLDLSNNSITDVGCQYLRQLRPYVRHLHLHKNAGIGDNGKRLLEDVFNYGCWEPGVCFDEESHNRENAWQE